MEIWSAIGGRFPSTSSSSMGTMGHFFGAAAGSVGGADVMSIQDALGNTRADGTGALLREGAAALLSSMTRAGFPYPTEQVRDAFAAAAARRARGVRVRTCRLLASRHNEKSDDLPLNHSSSTLDRWNAAARAPDADVCSPPSETTRAAPWWCPRPRAPRRASRSMTWPSPTTQALPLRAHGDHRADQDAAHRHG